VEVLMAKQNYCRSRDLPKLTGLWPRELDDLSLPGRRKLVSKLEGALRAERRRGLAGHWTYDLSRHIQLLAAYREERRALAEDDSKRPKGR
jgi:Family of unknown function (DUF6477)